MIKTVLATEKATRLMESENKLVFVVDKKATKKEIKKEIEEMFNVKIEHVNTMIGSDAKKKAYVTFSDNTPAIDLATKLGLM
ncbi:MAG: 50S ribosomal protein L23 [Candidatus Nanoarchaeia archaeon]|jgi:large subunit ribosomal protein L23|nr:50S ribosomal protein L23 [Candidatus Nanoarchaeia archaeon]